MVKVFSTSLLIFGFALNLFSSPVLDNNEVKVTLEKALLIAKKTASKKFDDLDKYILRSVSPELIKGDSKGMHWIFTWQEQGVLNYRTIIVRVYMKDGSTRGERGRKDAVKNKKILL